MCVHVVETCVRVSSHSQIQLIKMGETFRGDAVEGPPRSRCLAQVADGRCSQAEEQMQPDMRVSAWNNPSTVKPHEGLRQSLTVETPVLLLMFGIIIKSGPVLLELSRGLVREGSPLLVDWWNYNPG